MRATSSANAIPYPQAELEPGARMRPESRTTTQLRRWWVIALIIVIALAIYFLAIGAPPKPRLAPPGTPSSQAPATQHP
jgi:hypothetical protein